MCVYEYDMHTCVHNMNKKRGAIVVVVVVVVLVLVLVVVVVVLAVGRRGLSIVGVVAKKCL